MCRINSSANIWLYRLCKNNNVIKTMHVVTMITNKIKKQFGVVPTVITNNNDIHFSWLEYDLDLIDDVEEYRVILYKKGIGECDNFYVRKDNIQHSINYIFSQERLIHYVMDHVKTRSFMNPTLIDQQESEFSISWGYYTMTIINNDDTYHVVYDDTYHHEHSDGNVDTKNIYLFIDKLMDDLYQPRIRY